jgi:ubiquinone/menaquinone biosynthesis C-methylase UbiE
VIFERLADVYDSSGVAFFQPVGRRLIGLAGISPGDSVLDVGCGRGAVTLAAAEAVGPGGSVLGIDVAPSMLALLRAEAARRRFSQLAVARMDARHPGITPASLDVITGSMSIALFPGLREVVTRYLGLLRPGGRIAIAGPVPPRYLRNWTLGPLRIGLLAEEIDPAAAERSPWLARFLGEHPFGRPGEIGAALRDTGFVDVVEEQEDVELVASSPRALVDWTASHGMRVFWDHIPETRRAAVADVLVEELSRKQEAGAIAVYPVSYWLAAAPAA